MPKFDIVHLFYPVFLEQKVNDSKLYRTSIFAISFIFPTNSNIE